jgi:hypothetical protein
VLISTTLILVFFTTIVFGAFMPWVVNFFKQGDTQRVSNISEPSNKESNLEKYSIDRYERTSRYI